VAEKAPGARAPADAKLLAQVRAGDTSAFGVLYQRHVPAARRLARELVQSPAEADHLVAETFILVHEVTRSGGGPADAFRPYLLAALRRVSAGQVAERRAQPAGDSGPGEPPTLAASPDDSSVARGFLSLSERARAVLWHTEIEQDTAAEVAPLLGTSSNAVASMRHRARRNLRQAILSTHATSAASDCGAPAELLGHYQRGALPASDSGAVASHLAHCEACTAVIVALGDLTSALQHHVAPLYLGGAASAYLVSAQRDDPAGSAAAPAAYTSELPVAAGAVPPRAIRPAWFVAAGAALVAGATAAALALTGNATPPRPAGHTRADALPSAGVSGGADATPRALGSISQSAAALPSASQGRSAEPGSSASSPQSAQPGSSPSPKASTPEFSPSPTPGVTLTASVSVQQAWGLDAVSFQINDTGTAATGELTATITLPSGSWFIGMLHAHHGAGGWSCQPTSTGATCQHDAIAAGAYATGTMLIRAGGAACGQPVQVSASSGSATASAQSPQGIPCGNNQQARAMPAAR